MEKKIRPCDCKDQATVNLLPEQGIGHNDESITVEPNSVVLRMGHTTVRISMARFKMFAEWYLGVQELDYDKNKKSFCPRCGKEKNKLWHLCGDCITEIEEE